MHTSKKDYPVRVKELQERVQLAPALLAAFPLYATDNNAVHVIVETLSHCSEAERGKLFAALRGVVEKSLEQPDVALEEGVKEVEAPAQEEEEEEEEEEEQPSRKRANKKAAPSPSKRVSTREWVSTDR